MSMPAQDDALPAAYGQRAQWFAATVLLLATADLFFATAYWHYGYAVSPDRLAQNIAAGLLGKQAFAGGLHAVLLGLVLHYAIMAAMVGAYFLLSRRMTMLRKHPWRYGSAYGVLLYIVMNCIVLPLSAAPKTPFILSWILCSLAIHGAIGVATAHAARRAMGT